MLANSREDIHDIQLAKETLELVKDSDIDYTCGLYTYGLALRSSGNLTEAIKVFREAFGLKQKQGYAFCTILALNELLLSLELNGRLREAIRLGEDIVAEMIDHRGMPLPLTKVMYIPLGIFYYKANDLEQALKYSVEWD